MMLKLAVKLGWRKDNPARDVERVLYRSPGLPSWSDEEIAAYEARWPLGTKQRLALALLLYTGQRRSDAVRMGRQHLRDGGHRIFVKQQKTGAELLIPVHPELRRALDLVPADQLTFLLTDYGNAFTPAGFGMRFAEWRTAAGLPKRWSSHGLRKAAARRLAEAGATTQEIMAIGGWRTLAEVERYTRAADQARLARSAIIRLATPVGKSGKPRRKAAEKLAPVDGVARPEGFEPPTRDLEGRRSIQLS
jgi:integrase